METKNIWNAIQINQFDLNLEVTELYCNLMKQIKNCLKNYEAICYKTFQFFEKTQEELNLIKLELSKKLTEENYVYKINVNENKIKVVLYLLNISETQYKEIKFKKENMYLSLWKELFVSGLWELPFLLIYIFLEGFFLYAMFSIFEFTIGFWLSVIIFIFLTFILGMNLEKHRNRLRKQKAELVEQFNKYLYSLNRDFCNTNCNKEEIENLHNEYYEYPLWNEFLKYLKE